MAGLIDLLISTPDLVTKPMNTVDRRSCISSLDSGGSISGEVKSDDVITVSYTHLTLPTIYSV